ncbi:hypothetical protein B0H17DRAFT_1067749 [Mycena rosella]|uniref:Zn(2)-C6 fungal-type domain-containing protein n=1 Tax=Mycena rosella TaxID=1033263 RepID=A0AAD7GH85_MYCRO|nr:hypothetical protein B0H17DRAFT_1067749 [Mycena rosella]
MHDTIARKPPACDACRARRVLCHPQPNGAPCPRCAEKDTACITTSGPRGRPRKSPISKPPELVVADEVTQQLQSKIYPSSSSSMTLDLRSPQSWRNDCPDLTPELIAHLFQCFDRLPEVVSNPITTETSIKNDVRAVSYQLYLLPPESRTLALCIVALASLVSFHDLVLGQGPRPESFSDDAFFSSRQDMLSCGARRSRVHRALHAAARKAAWDAGVILQASDKNAASCSLLDILDELDSSGGSRPWASASISHLRTLAPIWRNTTPGSYMNAHWAAYLMTKALRATINRKPILLSAPLVLLSVYRR